MKKKYIPLKLIFDTINYKKTFKNNINIIKNVFKNTKDNERLIFEMKGNKKYLQIYEVKEYYQEILNHDPNNHHDSLITLENNNLEKSFFSFDSFDNLIRDDENKYLECNIEPFKEEIYYKYKFACSGGTFDRIVYFF
jgi:hypothetical protein